MKPHDTLQTPPHIVALVRGFLGGLDLDPASCEGNPTGARFFYTESTDGLAKPWDHPTVFCNPPYSRIPLWLEKAWEEFAVSEGGTEIIMLLPSWTDRKWFQKFGPRAAAICFLEGRLKHIDPATGGPTSEGARFGSMLVYFGPRYEEFDSYFSRMGVCR